MPPFTTACTCFLVTKGASADGVNTVTYAADSHTLYGYLFHAARANHTDGEQLDVFDWDSGEHLGVIAQVPHTYNVVGNVNEFGLAITESTWGGIAELNHQAEAVVDYGSLIRLALARAKTAREAIGVMTGLVSHYGYASEGESFSLADPEEVWMMEMIGKGEFEKGAVWVAQQIPDGYVAGHANQARIRFLEEGMLYSEDVVSFARRIGRFPTDAPDSAFSFSDVYNPVTFGSARGCDARVYDFFQRATAGDGTMDYYVDYALGYNLTNRMPLYIKPSQPVTTQALAAAMRSHYENTPLAFATDVGAGAFGLPYRWRPLLWEDSAGNTYFHERAAGTQQTGFNLLAQLRANVPDPIKALQYFAVDDTDSSVLAPFYGGQTEVPPSYGEGNISVFDAHQAFWVFNIVSNFCYSRYALIHPDIQAKQQEREEKHFALAASIDAAFVRLWDSGEEAKAVSMLNEKVVRNAEDLVTEWLAFFGQLFVKYMDGNVKTVPAEGSSQLLPTVAQPGYPLAWTDRVAQETGDRYKVPSMDAVM